MVVMLQGYLLFEISESLTKKHADVYMIFFQFYSIFLISFFFFFVFFLAFNSIYSNSKESSSRMGYKLLGHISSEYYNSKPLLVLEEQVETIWDEIWKQIHEELKSQKVISITLMICFYLQLHQICKWIAHQNNGKSILPVHFWL